MSNTTEAGIQSRYRLQLVFNSYSNVIYSSSVIHIGSSWRSSEKQCGDGRGYQQEEETGTSRVGTVTQVPFTAFEGTNTCYAGLAAFCDHFIP